MLVFGIPKNQLDGNGDGWLSEDENDYLLGFGDFNSEMGYSSDINFDVNIASGYNYTVQIVPEPATWLMLVLGLAIASGKLLASGRVRR